MGPRRHTSCEHPSAHRGARTNRSNRRMPARPREQGAFAVMFVPLLLLVLVMCGLALDAGAMYNRKVEVSGLAKAAALAAAQELNGTSQGIISAQQKAEEIAKSFKYQYGIPVPWDNAALKFSTTPDRAGAWKSASEITNPSQYYFARVDTSLLGSAVGTVQTIFMAAFSNSLRTVKVNEIAVAGRASINIVPIAICAMSEDAVTERTHTGLAATELVQYGFRRGVSYDLMQLNPKATDPARFAINPVVAPDMSSSSFDVSIMGPFMCAGTMWIPRVTDGSLHVTSLLPTSPLESLYKQLNSRFDDYSGNLCSPSNAPPDTNIKAYPYDTAGGAPWMVPATGTLSAKRTTERGRLETVADIPSPGSTLPGLTAASYGPLWAYAKAVKYSSTEPNTGYAPFATTDWEKLYATGLSAIGYPPAAQNGTPYNPVGVSFPNTIASTTNTARKEFAASSRRVINIPLLSCETVPSGSNVLATVKGIGRFFMTVPATKDKLIAEFAGTAPENSLVGIVELYP